MQHYRFLARPVASILAFNINDKKQWLITSSIGIYLSRLAMRTPRYSIHKRHHDTLITYSMRNPIAASVLASSIPNG